MKNQTLFSSKDKSKKIKLSSDAIFIWHFKGYDSQIDQYFKSIECCRLVLNIFM